MAQSVLWLFCVLQLYAVGQAKMHYSIISPGTIHPNSIYSVVVSNLQVSVSYKIKLAINAANFVKITNVEVQPMSMEIVNFTIPDTKRGTYILIAHEYSGWLFTNTTYLEYADNRPSVYVQIDKATYKPGDLVQFRIIFLDEHTRPAKINQPIGILIKDALQNRLKQFSNITLTKGVFSGKLQLSEFPMRGDWQIEVFINGESIKTKSFTVDKYVLPKFEVTIEAPKKVSTMEEKLSFIIYCRYTFGKLVKGKAIITVKSSNHRPSVEMTINFNGKALFELNMEGVLAEGISDDALNVSVTVEEELTGNRQNASARIEVVSYRFNINAPNILIDCTEPDQKFNYSISLKNLADEPISDPKYPVIMKQTLAKSDHLEIFSNKNGIATIELDCSTHNISHFVVEYRGQIEHGTIGRKSKSVEDQKKVQGVYVKTNKPQLGQIIDIEVKSNELLTYFVYAIVARGNIQKSEIISIPNGGSISYTFQVQATFEMMPIAHVYVHYVQNNDLKFYETSFSLKKEFQNRITIDAAKQTKPGEDVVIKINTNANSFVGLMAVDQSVLLLKSDNDFDQDDILQSLDKVTSKTPVGNLDRTHPYPGAESGVITMTNAHYPHRSRHHLDDETKRHYFESGYMINYLTSSPNNEIKHLSTLTSMFPITTQPSAPLEKRPKLRVRKKFPESWFYDDFESSDNNDLIVTKKVPDTITSWAITGFSLNPLTGFALTEAPTKIQTFRPFFIATNLPYSIKRGELVSVPVIIFNYMDRDIQAEVTMENDENQFEFTDSIEDQSKRTKYITVSSNNGETIAFTIRAKSIGHITLKISATSSIAGDAIRKELKVEPEGVTIYKNHDYYLNTKDVRGDFTNVVQQLYIPEDIVHDSEHIEVSIMGNILGSTISNLGELVRMPAGCGEQNMINFVPNILILRYLESIHQLSPSIAEKAKHFLEIGYQSELNYKHDDGSYSAFGKSDLAGSTWLTAYVMRSFHQASKYIDIDPKILNAGLDFLAHKQASNGSFPEYGQVLDFSHHNELGLTAFVLLAFLENSESVEKYKNVINRGFQYLQDNANASDDLYALSIAVYALQLRKLQVNHLLTKLDVKARIDGGHKWWSKAVAEVRPGQDWRPKSHDVEVTAYILLTLLDMDESVLPITKWLVSQRNSNGGFASTQETVVGLQALIKFAEKSSAGHTELNIEVSTVGVKVGQFKVNEQNAMVVQTLDLPTQTREATLKAEGSGTAILQISYRYNIMQEKERPSFLLSTNLLSGMKINTLDMEACAEFIPLKDEDSKESNMVVMEVSLPSGYTVLPETLDKIMKVESVKRVESKNSDTNIIVYFDGLTVSNKKCIPITAERSHEVAGQKPVPIVIYDYYDSQKRTTTFYHVENSLCDICADDECTRSCAQQRSRNA